MTRDVLDSNKQALSHWRCQEVLTMLLEGRSIHIWLIFPLLFVLLNPWYCYLLVYDENFAYRVFILAVLAKEVDNQRVIWHDSPSLSHLVRRNRISWLISDFQPNKNCLLKCDYIVTMSETKQVVEPDMKGWLYKWTNYLKGYQKRWFVLSNGILSYYRWELRWVSQLLCISLLLSCRKFNRPQTE